jgi:hypothetical protein
MDPKRSIELLNALVELGFTDEAFSRLHQRRLADQKVTIERHQRYCAETIESFRPDGENELLQQRLALVLNAYRAGGFNSRRSQVWMALADAAFHELPPLRAALDHG